MRICDRDHRPRPTTLVINAAYNDNDLIVLFVL